MNIFAVDDCDVEADQPQPGSPRYDHRLLAYVRLGRLRFFSTTSNPSLSSASTNAVFDAPSLLARWSIASATCEGILTFITVFAVLVVRFKSAIRS